MKRSKAAGGLGRLGALDLAATAFSLGARAGRWGARLAGCRGWGEPGRVRRGPGLCSRA
jgi:hypothetical protein